MLLPYLNPKDGSTKPRTGRPRFLGSTEPFHICRARLLFRRIGLSPEEMGGPGFSPVTLYRAPTMPRDRAPPVGARVSALRVTIVAALATVPELEKPAAVLAPVKATRFAGGLRPTLTTSPRDCPVTRQVGTKGWSSRSNKRIDPLPAIGGQNLTLDPRSSSRIAAGMGVHSAPLQTKHMLSQDS